MPEFENNADLVNYLESVGVIKSPSVKRAFLAVDRKDFVPEEYKELAYVDNPIPLPLGQSVSQPYTVAFMLELLQIEEKDKVLDIGSGSGWTTALIAEILRGGGFVLGLEIIPALCKFGQENLKKYRFSNAEIRLAEKGVLGAPELAPFDKILVSASANEIPSELKKQLKAPGKMVLPVGNSIVKFQKGEKGNENYESFDGFSFVPLI